MREFWGLEFRLSRRHARSAAGDRDRRRGGAGAAARPRRGRIAFSISAPAAAACCWRCCRNCRRRSGIGVDRAPGAAATARRQCRARSGSAARAGFRRRRLGGGGRRRGSTSSSPTRPISRPRQSPACRRRSRFRPAPGARRRRGRACGLSRDRRRRCRGCCAPGGIFAAEIGAGSRAGAVAAILSRATGLRIEWRARADLAGIARCVVARSAAKRRCRKRLE